MQFSVKTDKGPVRENNQDYFDCGETNGLSWAIVCDGMGGVNGGQVASQLCVEIVGERLKANLRSNMNYTSVRNLLESSIQAANAAILAKGGSDSGLRGMGTTVVAAVVNSGVAVLAHAGDSRIYKLSEEGIVQLTKDHSVVQMLIDNGDLAPELALSHPDRNVITRAVGVSDTIDVDVDIADIWDGDTLLLCTDGLTGCVSDKDILSVVNNCDFSISAKNLVDLAIDNGTADNVTAVLMTNND